MNATENRPAESIESLCAALRAKYDRMGHLAEEAREQFRQDEPAVEILAELETLARDTVPLQQAISEASSRGLEGPAKETLDETGKVLAVIVERINMATGEATTSVQRLGGRIDEGIQGRKGNQAYLTNHP